MNSDELSLLLEQAERKKWENLLLYSKNLFIIPKEVFTLTNLTILSVSADYYFGSLSDTYLIRDKGTNKLTENLNEYVIGNFPPVIPSSIERLKQLKTLQILHSGDIVLEGFDKSLPKLVNLQHLILTKTRLNTFSLLDFGLLKKLRILRLSDNKLAQLPEGIGKLEELQELDVQNNKLNSLPYEISYLKNLKILNVHNNNLPIPPEIIDKINNPKDIISYYFSVIEQIRKPINEIKLLVVGQGSVGKTSLVTRILQGTFDPNQTKTEGISINQWQVEGGALSVSKGSQKREREQQFEIENRKSEIKLNIWDFGGQEIMHATHQFFLTKRSLYLLVLDARLTQEENRVEYWLKIIQSFGGESPVLIVGNKTDQHPLDIDRTGLQNKYPNVVGILDASAAKGSGIETLKAVIALQVHTLPHIRDLLPETWFTVKSKLEELGRDQNFITQDEYLRLCATNYITDESSQHTLIGFLHDLGVVLHFQDDPRLEALGILNPQWVTNGVYKILNSHELFQNQGTLTLPILNKTLNPPEYPSNKRLFIVDMMKKFELCYDIEPDKSFLIPDLLPKDEPFTGEWDGALAFQYHYNVLPTSIISRFIVRMNAFVHKTVWRSGVVLKSGGNTALVKADTEDRKIFIWVSEDVTTRRDFLSAIRLEFDAIHKTIAKIEATEKVPLPNYPKADPVDYQLLLQLEQKGILTHHVQADTDLVEVTVRDLLDGVRPSKNQAAKIFISYGHDDKTFVKKLADDLGKDSIEAWWDFDKLKGGNDWQKEIQKGIKLCDFFIVVLSPNSVNRDWVLKEITFANEYKKKIIPLMLKECERPISIIEKQYIDFEKQTQKSALKELMGILKPNS